MNFFGIYYTILFMKKRFKEYVKKVFVILTVMLLSMHCVFVTTYADESSNDDIVSNGDYIEIDENKLDSAEENSANYISELKELYGESISALTNFTYEEIASIVLLSYYGVQNEQEIVLGKELKLFDANDANTYIGFNYSVSNNQRGYITISTHTKNVLIRDIVENRVLPEYGTKIYYLSSGEIYYFDRNIQYYTTLVGTKIPKEEFIAFLEERRQAYYSITKEQLDALEINTLSQINNLTYIKNNEFHDEFLGKSYSGQQGYGYGGIYDCFSYLKNRYGGSITLKSSKYLPMESFKMSELESKAANCSLTAITRILKYYNQKGYKRIDNNYYAIYAKVRKVATKYGYTPSKGTGYKKINNIVEEVLDDYGYKKGKCNGIYIWTFKEQVKKEIDANRPVIMNIARGYYGNHTVTVCGYGIYMESGRTTHNMIQIYDGWERYRRYIDYEAFAYDLITSGFGSFNTIRMK